MRYGKVGHLVLGGIMEQQFDIASTLLDEITKTNFHQKRSSNSIKFGMTNDQVEKNPNRHKNEEKMMSHMKFLTKQVMGVLVKSNRLKRYQDQILGASKKSRDNSRNVEGSDETQKVMKVDFLNHEK